MDQMSAKPGIKKHGEEAVSAILKEFGQLEHMKTFKPRHKHSLTREPISRAMRIITMIKEKCRGVLKGRSCVDGRPQWVYISEEEAASPTTALESLLITLLIDAWEGRDVATADVVGAYLNAYMEDFVIVKLVGDEVDIISKLNPEYKELYPFAKIVGKANILIMPGQHSAAISYKLMKSIGDTKVIGPLLIGLGLPIEIAPLRSSTSEILNLASIAAYSADVIDYKK